MPSYQSQGELGSFLPTTQTKLIQQQINSMSMVINTKISGYYALTEFINGAFWYPDPLLDSTTSQAPSWRQEFRKVISTGTLANTGTTTIAHGLTITPEFTFTRIYGAATDPSTTFIPLPYSSPVLVENIAVFIDAVNVNITTGSDRTGFTTSYIVIEYLKN